MVPVIEIAEGKSAVEVGNASELLPTLELLKKAVESGELDVQIESASIKLREGFGKQLQKLRKVCTTLAKASYSHHRTDVSLVQASREGCSAKNSYAAFLS